MSEIPSVSHGILYLSIQLSDDPVIMGVDSGPQQSVSLLQQATQVFVSALIHTLRGGRATQG